MISTGVRVDDDRDAQDRRRATQTGPLAGMGFGCPVEDTAWYTMGPAALEIRIWIEDGDVIHHLHVVGRRRWEP